MTNQSIEAINASKIKEIKEAFKGSYGISHYTSFNEESAECLYSHVYQNRYLFISADSAVRKLLRGKDCNKIKVYDLISERKLIEKKIGDEFAKKIIAENPYAASLAGCCRVKQPFASIFSRKDVDDVVSVVAKNPAKTILMHLADRHLLADENIKNGFVYGVSLEGINQFMALERSVHIFIEKKPTNEAMVATIATAKEMLKAVSDGILNQCKFVYENATDECVDFEACLAGIKQVHDLCYPTN